MSENWGRRPHMKFREMGSGKFFEEKYFKVTLYIIIGEEINCFLMFKLYLRWAWTLNTKENVPFLQVKGSVIADSLFNQQSTSEKTPSFVLIY